MIPGIMASGIMASDRADATLLYESNGGGEPFNFNVDVGPAFPHRMLVIMWGAQRGKVTGQPGTVNVTIDGVVRGAESSVGSQGYYSYMVVHALPEGDGVIPISVYVQSYTARNIRVWMVGTPERRSKIVSSAQAYAGQAAAVAVGLMPGAWRPGTKILTHAARRNQPGAADLIEEAWIDHTSGDYTSNDSVGTTRMQAGSGEMPAEALVLTHPATEASHHKFISQVQTAPASPNELIYTAPGGSFLYHFSGDYGAFSDADGLEQCQDGDPVQLWRNRSWQGRPDAIQPTLARRPIFRTGGLNGRPYLECQRSLQQFFNDLLDTGQNSGLAGHNPFMVAAVVEFDDLATINPLLGGSPAGTKSRAWVTTTGALSIHKNGLSSAAGLIEPGVPYCITMNLQNNTNAQFRVDGPQYTVSNASNSPSTAVAASQFLRSSGDGLFFHGKLYEFCYWRANVNTNQTYNTVRGLMEKYGLL